LADPWDILYGAERFEVAMKSKGYDDPYDMEPNKRKAVSTKADPNIVQSLMESRVIGCICEADTHHINYMWIAKGETKRCECGHWFKCVERELPDLSDYGIQLEKGHH
jgi:cytochrome c oxidase subunit 5b